MPALFQVRRVAAQGLAGVCVCVFVMFWFAHTFVVVCRYMWVVGACVLSFPVSAPALHCFPVFIIWFLRSLARASRMRICACVSVCLCLLAWLLAWLLACVRACVRLFPLLLVCLLAFLHA